MHSHAIPIVDYSKPNRPQMIHYIISQFSVHIPFEKGVYEMNLINNFKSSKFRNSKKFHCLVLVVYIFVHITTHKKKIIQQAFILTNRNILLSKDSICVYKHVKDNVWIS